MDLPFGWVHATLETALRKHSRGKKTILEIGSFVGRSTCIIAQEIKASETSVIFDTVDPHFATADDFVVFYHKIYNRNIEVPIESRRYFTSSCQ